MGGLGRLRLLGGVGLAVLESLLVFLGLLEVHPHGGDQLDGLHVDIDARLLLQPVGELLVELGGLRSRALGEGLLGVGVVGHGVSS